MELRLSAAEWSDASKLVDVLEPFKKYSVLLQSIQCTLSDFYGFWQKLKVKTSKHDDPFALALLEEMSRREESLIRNPLLLSAVYLDLGSRYISVFCRKNRRQ